MSRVMIGGWSDSIRVSMALVGRFLSKVVFVPRGSRCLVYANAPPMRGPLACLSTFERAVAKGPREIPPSAADAKEFRAQARPQPPQGSPAWPTSPWTRARRAGTAARGKGGRTSGRRFGRLRSRLSAKRLRTGRWKRRPFLSFATAASNLNGGANRHRIGSALAYSSRRVLSGTRTATDKNPSRRKSKK
jgi:hypothetical protein